MTFNIYIQKGNDYIQYDSQKKCMIFGAWCEVKQIIHFFNGNALTTHHITKSSFYYTPKKLHGGQSTVSCISGSQVISHNEKQEKTKSNDLGSNDHQKPAVMGTVAETVER